MIWIFHQVHDYTVTAGIGFSRTVNLIRGPIHTIFLMNYELDRRSSPLDAYLYDSIFSCFYFCFQLSRTYELLVDFWNAVSIHHVIPHWLILLELHGSVFVRRPLVRRCQNNSKRRHKALCDNGQSKEATHCKSRKLHKKLQSTHHPT